MNFLLEVFLVDSLEVSFLVSLQASPDSLMGDRKDVMGVLKGDLRETWMMLGVL